MHEKRWLFDTVALSNFLLSDAAYILEKRYRKCGIITWEVYDEISAGFAEHPALKYVDEMIDSKIFSLATLSRKAHKVFLGLIGHLGKGEASCIASAKIQSGIVVTDDRAARKICRQLEIPVTGTVGILKASVLSDQLSLAVADIHLKKMIISGFYSPVLNISDIV
ncbi:MAG: hypothetical protein JRH15_08685 [Deltaproteobacteria bacterium]|nr:hypothetical protein [Deltaproteobacteria bacterium]